MVFSARLQKSSHVAIANLIGSLSAYKAVATEQQLTAAKLGFFHLRCRKAVRSTAFLCGLATNFFFGTGGHSESADQTEAKLDLFYQ